MHDKTLLTTLLWIGYTLVILCSFTMTTWVAIVTVAYLLGVMVYSSKMHLDR